MHSAVIKLKKKCMILLCVVEAVQILRLVRGLGVDILYRDNVSIADRHHTLPELGILDAKGEIARSTMELVMLMG
jgi:hypothetical protein